MNITKKFLSILLAVMMVVTSIIATSIIPANAAVKAPVFTVKSVTDLTYNNAKISAHITNPGKAVIKKVGFQIGTASNKLTTTKFDNVNKAYNYVDTSFLMSKYKVSLKENTTYYYRFYITAGNKTTYSSIYTFKTLSSISIRNEKATDITYNNAVISGTATNLKGYKFSKLGFQLGLKNNNLNINKSYNYSGTNKTWNYGFKMSSHKITLKPNTTYYYRTYAVVGGKTYTGTVHSFKTLTDLPTISVGAASGITTNNAIINGTMKNPKGLKITKIGFQLGTTSNNLTINKSYGANLTDKSKALCFTISQYKVTLKANTTYSYRMYVVAGGKTYYSAVKSFKTTATPVIGTTAWKWPVPQNKKISNGYRSEHKGIDIAGNTSYNIVATKAGKVEKVFTGCNNKNAAATKKSCNKSTCAMKNTVVLKGLTICNYGNGRGVIVKHNDGTYSCYAHMSSTTVKVGQSVKQGQVLGKMGNYGYSNGVHLHFAISKGSWGAYNINPTPNTGIKYIY